MESIATGAGRRLPVCKPRLAWWSLRENEQYLVRNRSTGETFQLGQEEQFILEQLDGRLTAEQVRAAFAERFGQALSEKELEEFIDLAAERGFLQPDNAQQKSESMPAVSQQRANPELRTGQSKAGQKRGSASGAKHIIGRLLSATETLLQCSAQRFKAAQWRIHFFHLKHFGFVPRPDDIFIVTYPRSGTTWMQMILYQLTTDGSMDIPHIAEYCPWFERSLRSGRGFETRPSPRLFKSHLPYQKIPKGPGKYIYVAREGRDVAVSYYHLYRTYQGYAGTFAEFFEQFLCGKVQFGSWFQHVRGWWEQRRDPNVLFLTYEELARDLEGCIRKVSAFCGLHMPAERVPGIVARCSFNFMKKHEAQFDPTMETLWEEGVQLNSFLRAGKAGEGALHLSRGQQEEFDRAFRRHLGQCGLPQLMFHNSRSPLKT